MRVVIAVFLVVLVLFAGGAQEKAQNTPLQTPAETQSLKEPATKAQPEAPVVAESLPEPQAPPAPEGKLFIAEMKYNTQIRSFSKATIAGIIDKSAPGVVKQTLFVVGLPRLPGKDVFETTHKDGADFDYYSTWLVDESGKRAWIHTDDLNPFSAGETKLDALFNRADLPAGSSFEGDYDKLAVTIEANAAEAAPAPSKVVLYTAFFDHDLDPDNLVFKYNVAYPDFGGATGRFEFGSMDTGIAVNGVFNGIPRLEEMDDPAVDGAASGVDFDYYAVWLIDSKGKNKPVLAGKFNAESSGPTSFTAALKPAALKGTDFHVYDRAYVSVEVDGKEPSKPSEWVIFTGTVQPA